MKLCRDHALAFVESYEGKYIMKHDMNGKQCEVKIDGTDQCESNAKFTVITP